MTRQRLVVWLAWGLLIGLPFGLLAVMLVSQLWQGGTTVLAGVVTHQRRLLTNTASYGLASACAATLLGWALAHVQHRYRFAGRGLLHVLGLAGLVMPSFTFAMALVILLGHNGWLTRWLGGPLVDVYGLLGLVVSGTLARLPYAYLAMLLAYRHIDARQLEAAVALGAGRTRVFGAVLVPRLAPALLSVGLMTFADTVADLANPLVIGGGFGVLSSHLYAAINGEADLGAASAYAVTLLLPAMVFWVVSGRLGVRRPSGVDARPADTLARRPRGLGWLLVGVAWGVGVVVLSCVAVVGLAAVFPSDGGPSLSAFGLVVAGPYTKALASTVLLVSLTLPVVALVSLVLTLAAAPKHRWLRAAERWCGVLSSIPNLVLGLAAFLLLTAVRTWLGDSPAWRFAGAFLALLTVYALRAIPAAALGMLGASRTLVPDVRAAARSLGAGPWRMMRAVYVPRLRPAMREAMVMTVARTLTATSSVILLSDAQVPLLTVRTLVEVDAGRLATAAAMTVMSGALIGIVALVANGGWRHDRTS